MLLVSIMRFPSNTSLQCLKIAFPFGLDGLINHFLIRMPLNNSPLQHLLKATQFKKCIWSRLHCLQYLSQRHKTKCLIPSHCCGGDLLHCSKRRRRTGDGERRTNFSSFQRKTSECLTCFCCFTQRQTAY